MLIRTEAPADILPIDRLLKSAFTTSEEASLVSKLRENSRITLSLVACNDEGEVIGFALFTPVTLEGQDLGWQGLAPVAVAQEYRNQGIAKQLIQEGFTMMLEFGYPVAVVLGDPEFYSKVGFQSATESGLSCEWDVPEGVFQVNDLTQNATNGLMGMLRYSPEFYV